MCSAVSERLERAIEDTNAGGDARHDRMLSNQTALVRMGAEGHVGVLEALTEMQGAFVASIADRTGSDDAQAEFDRGLSGAVALIEAKPSVMGADPCGSDEEELSDFERKVMDELERIEIKTEAQARFMAKRSGELEVPELMSSWDASLVVGDGVEWAIDGLIPQERGGVADGREEGRQDHSHTQNHSGSKRRIQAVRHAPGPQDREGPLSFTTSRCRLRSLVSGSHAMGLPGRKAFTSRRYRVVLRTSP